MKNQWLSPEVYIDKSSNKIEVDHDCGGGDACSLSSITLHHVPDFEDKPNILWKQNLSEHRKVNERYTSVYGPFHSVAVLNKSAFQLLDEFSNPKSIINIRKNWKKHLPQEIIDATIEKFISAKLLVPEKTKFQLKEIPDVLTVWLHLTDRCNLRCKYCYLPHKQEDMTVGVGKASLKSAFNSAVIHGYPSVKIKFSGGEPLLAFPTLQKLHDYAQKIAQQQGIRLRETILSNGTLLTKELARSISQMNIGLMISMDGLDEIHNNQRPFANGDGSSEKVIEAIEIAQEEEITPEISITVTAKSVKGLPKTIEWILKKGLPFKINFFRENDLSLSLESINEKNEAIINGMITAFETIEKLMPKESLLNSLADRADLSKPHLRTCGVGQNYLVFNQYGQVAKCQMQMQDLINNANSSDPLQAVRKDKKGVQNVSVNEKEECAECEWRYWCTGGCPLQTYQSTNSYFRKSPNCNIYKAIYPKMIFLESIRICKTNGLNPQTIKT